MTTNVALLRAINVGGHAQLPMADVLAFFVRLGFPDARTLLQTGNVVFSGAKRAGASTAREWQALVAANPFPAMARRDPGKEAE